jgi:hypothetical protein
VAVYGKTGVTRVGLLPVIGLKFSEEVGGSGSCTFEALKSDLDTLSAWDAVIRIEIETAPGVWTMGPCYVTRHEYSHKAGSLRYSMTCRGLLEAWADETVFLPEYVVSIMPKKSGAERGVGWMSSAYSTTGDPNEPWDRCYLTSRTTKPPDWPTGTNAEWISASGASSEMEAKYFRSTMTITGSASRLVRFYLSSDESATLWVAGERIIETNSVETGKDEFSKADMVLFPGTYAIGIYTATHFTKGGDGMDPVIAAGAILNEAGDPSSWIMRTDDATWKACRRDTEPPDDIPPGPTPGQTLLYLIGEAKERDATGWDNVTYSFTNTHDSYGVPWVRDDVAERMFRYGHHTYWAAFEAWAEANEFDVWMNGDLVLRAAPRQGQARSGMTFTTTHLRTFSTTGTEGYGTWVLAQAHDGWVYHAASGPRREYAIELGEAITGPIASKIAKASLKDVWRHDGSGSLNPPQSGWMPYVDFKLGDWLRVTYKDINQMFSVTSLSAIAGEGGLLWDIEFTEYPPEQVIPMLVSAVKDAEAHPLPPEVGMFDGLEATT